MGQKPSDQGEDMLTRSKWVSGWVLAMTICLAAYPVLAAEFSATVVSKAGGQTMHGKVFMKGDKMRSEFQAGGEENITITRPDKKVVWVAMPQQKMYMEMPLSDKMHQKMMMKDPEERAKMKLLGTETVNGYECEKYEMSTTVEGKPVKHYTWVAKKLGMPIKSEAADGSMTMEYRDIKVGGVPDSAFEMPQGYQKMDMPFKMPPPK
jgi:outer membrane lipoprotein-sorting protein